MFQTETITIEHPDNPGAPMIINKSDFDPAVHKAYEPPVEPHPPEGDQSPQGADAPTPKNQGAKSRAKSEA